MIWFFGSTQSLVTIERVPKHSQYMIEHIESGASVARYLRLLNKPQLGAAQSPLNNFLQLGRKSSGVLPQ